MISYGRHASFALRHAVEFDLGADVATRSHLASRASQARRTHVLDANDRAGLHGFEASFEQQLFEEWIADLNVGTLRFGGFAEFFAGHGRAVNAVASGFRPHINHRIAFARGLCIKDLIAPHQAQGERIHQRITRIARLKFSFSAEVGHAEAVSVRSNAADHAFEQ